MDLLEQIAPEIAALYPKTRAPRRTLKLSQPAISPEVEDTLAQKLGRQTISFASKAGNALDLPGSMVRDVATWLPGGPAPANPFDQLLTPLSDVNRTSGRQLLRGYGAIRNQDTTGNFWGGLGAEVALDPLTYLTFGGAALGKAGQAAKAAGLMDDLPRIAAKKAGAVWGDIGKRQARVSTTLDDILKFGDDSQKARAQALLNAGQKGDEVMGGMIGFGLPFMQPSAIAGTGKVGQQVAKGMDAVGSAVRYGKIPGTDFSPGDTVARLFDATIGDAKTKLGQQGARALFNDKTKVRYDARLEAAKYSTRLEQMGMTGTDIGDQLRKLAEQPHLRTPGDPLSDMVEQMTASLGLQPGVAEEWGTRLSEFLDDYVDYFPRHATANVINLPGQKAKRFQAGDAGNISRGDFLRDIPEGTDLIKEIAKDTDIENAIVGGKSVDDISKQIEQKYGSRLPPTFEQRLDDGSGATKTMDRYSAMASWLGRMSPELRKSGVFGNHPILDFQARLISAGDALAGTKMMVEMVAQPGVLQPATDAANAGLDTIRLGDFLLANKITPGDVNGGFLKKYAEAVGIDLSVLPPDDANKLLKGFADQRIEKTLANDLAGFVKPYTTPEIINDILKLTDSFANLWKGSLTSPWLAYQVRNLLSGQAQNAMAGQWDPSSVNGAWAIVRGKEIRGAKDFPGLRQMYEREQLDAVPGAAPTPAYHGSPHKFDEFSTKHMGSGEGAQAYGWGMYFASDEDIARHYRDTLSERIYPDPEILSKYYEPGAIINTRWGTKARVLSFQPGAKDAPHSWSVTVQEVRGTGDGYRPIGPVITHSTLPEVGEIKARIPDYKPGAMYKVDLKPKDDEYLLWDRPLKDQSEATKKAVARLLPGYDETRLNDGKSVYEALQQSEDWGVVDDKVYDIVKKLNIDKKIGDDAYDALETFSKGNRITFDTLEQSAESLIEKGHPQRDVNRFFSTLSENIRISMTPEQASRTLFESGVRGIKFLDANSRHRVYSAQYLIPEIEQGIEKVNRKIDSINADKAANANNPQMTPAYFQRLDAEIAANQDRLDQLTKQLDRAKKDADGSHNYVIFDDADVSIEARYSPKGQSSKASQGNQTLPPGGPNWTAQEAHQISDPAFFGKISPKHQKLSNQLDKLVKEKGILPEDAAIMRLIFAQANPEYLPDVMTANRSVTDKYGRKTPGAWGIAEPWDAKTQQTRVTLKSEPKKGAKNQSPGASAEGTRVLLHEMAHIVWFEAQRVGSAAHKQMIDEFRQISKSTGTKPFYDEFLSSGNDFKQAEHHAGFGPKSGPDPSVEQFAEYFANSVLNRKVPTGAIGQFMTKAMNWLIDKLNKIRAAVGLDPKIKTRLDQMVDELGGFNNPPTLNFQQNVKANLGNNQPPVKPPPQPNNPVPPSGNQPVNNPPVPPGAGNAPPAPPQPQPPAPQPPGPQPLAWDDKIATDFLGRLIYAHQVVGKYDHYAAANVGQASQLASGDILDMLGGIPQVGRNAVNPGRIARKFVGMEPGTNLNPLAQRGVGDRTVSNFGPAAAGEDMSYITEAFNRISPWLYHIKRGVHPAEATARVNAAQVAYQRRNFSPTENALLTRFFPFYKFTSRATPFLIKQILEQPGGKFAQMLRMQNAGYDPASFEPDYVRETASIPVNDGPLEALFGKAPEGTNRYLSGFGLAYEDPLSFDPTNPRAFGLEVLSRMNPIVKAPLEMITGQTFFQKGPEGGRPLDDLDPILGRLISNVQTSTGETSDPVKFPGSQSLDFILGNSPIARALTTAKQLTDPRKREDVGLPFDIPGRSALLNALTGLRVSDISEGARDAIEREQLQQAMKPLGSKQFVRSYIPEEVKAKMTPEQREQAELYMALLNQLAQDAKARAAARDKAKSGGKAPLPVAVP